MKHTFCVRLEREKDLILPAMLAYISRSDDASDATYSSTTYSSGAIAEDSDSGGTTSNSAAPLNASHGSSDTLSASMLVKRISSGFGWESLYCVVSLDELVVYTEPSAVASVMTFSFVVTGSNRFACVRDDARADVLRLSGGGTGKQEALLQFASAGKGAGGWCC
jgi:hypothetical protein